MRQPTGLLAERYEVITEVPKGLASSCYFGIDSSMGRAVVVRLVGLAQSARMLASRAAKQRHLATVLEVINEPEAAAFPDVPNTQGVCAVVAEVFRGSSLRTAIRRERLGVDRSVAWVLRIAEALRELHNSGASHGAVSPYSIFASVHGRPIAPVLSQLIVPPLALFASPERLTGRGPSASDDLWALSVLLYCLLTGNVPFQGDTPSELLKSIHETSRSQLTLKPGPNIRELETAVRRWLAPARHRRPSTADDIIEVLDRWERRAPTSVQPLTPITSDSRPPNYNATLAAGDELVFDDSQIPESYDAALSVLQEDRNLPRTAGYSEARESAPSNSAVPRSVTPYHSSARPPAVVQSTPSIAPENPDAFTHRLRWRPRWGLLSILVALVGAGVGAAVVSVLGGSSNMARTVARVVQQHSQTSTNPTRVVSSQPRVDPRKMREQCIHSYFPADAFGGDPDLEFVCRKENLLEVSQRLNALAVVMPPSSLDGGTPSARNAQPAGTASAAIELVVTPGSPLSRTWQLGWYELLATAIIQHSCCQDPPVIRLPVSTGWCQQLQSVVTNIANLSTKPADISPAVRAFDETITCLMSQGKHVVYPFKGVPTPIQKAAFQQFLTRAAEMDARRASKKY